MHSLRIVLWTLSPDVLLAVGFMFGVGAGLLLPAVARRARRRQTVG